MIIYLTIAIHIWVSFKALTKLVLKIAYHTLISVILNLSMRQNVSTINLPEILNRPKHSIYKGCVNKGTRIKPEVIGVSPTLVWRPQVHV